MKRARPESAPLVRPRSPGSGTGGATQSSRKADPIFRAAHHVLVVVVALQVARRRSGALRPDPIPRARSARRGAPPSARSSRRRQAARGHPRRLRRVRHRRRRKAARPSSKSRGARSQPAPAAVSASPRAHQETQRHVCAAATAAPTLHQPWHADGIADGRASHLRPRNAAAGRRAGGPRSHGHSRCPLGSAGGEAPRAGPPRLPHRLRASASGRLGDRHALSGARATVRSAAARPAPVSRSGARRLAAGAPPRRAGVAHGQRQDARRPGRHGRHPHALSCVSCPRACCWASG